MKEFLLIFQRFVPPYKRYITMAVVFNLLSAVLNVFSFAALIPILQILFRTQGTATATHLMNGIGAMLRMCLPTIPTTMCASL